MYKLLLTIILVFFMGAVQAQEIEWMTMNEALKAQEKEPKKIFMDAYTTWCGPCKLLDKNTFSNKDVAGYVNDNYYPVKFNAEGIEEIFYKDFNYKNPGHDPDRKGRNTQHQFASALGISGYPSLVFFDEEGKLLGPITGYRTPRQLEIYLRFFAEDEHKQVNTNEEWQEYEKRFKPTFKN